MRAPRYAGLAWFLCGFTGGIATSLLWSGSAGALLLLAVTGLGAAALFEQRSPGKPAALLGLLAGLDAFVVSLVISPPCKYPLEGFERSPDGTFQAVCETQQLGGLAILAGAGTLAIAGLVWILDRHRKNRTDDRSQPEARGGNNVQLACAAVAVLGCVAVVAPVLAVNSWSPTALVRMAVDDELRFYALEQQPDFALFNSESHYDGIYFYAVANDPLARGEPHQVIDLASHRYAHPLYGWLGWLFSAGHGPAVPFVMMLISIVAMAVAAVMTSRLAEHLGMSPWWGLFPSVTPGLLASVSWDTAEPLAAAVVTGGLLYWLRGQKFLGGVLLIAVCMTRQPFSVIPIGLAAWELLRRRQGQSTRETIQRLTILAAGPVCMVLWQIYLRTRFEEWPFETADLVLTVPFQGWSEALRLAAVIGGGEFAQLGLLSLPMLAAHLLAALIVTSRALQMRNPIAPVFIALILIWYAFDQSAIVFTKDLLRFSAIPWLLAPFVLARMDRDTYD